MEDRSPVGKCLSFINLQIGPRSKEGTERELGARPFLTVSRQTGAGGITFAESVAEYVNARRPKKSVPWTVFDRNLVEKILEEHNLPARIAEYMAEQKRPVLLDTVEELLGIHPSAWRLVQQTTETVLNLASLGSCILVGRGAMVVTQGFPNALHVRLVGSFDKRVEAICDHLGMTPEQAAAYVKEQDIAREKYLRRYFKVSADDAMLYHLVLNTDRVAIGEAAALVGEALLARIPVPATPRAFELSVVS